MLKKKIAFLFPGQGSQVVGMGQDLYQEFGYVRELFDMVDEITKSNISKLCFTGPMEELTLTINLQPAMTAVNLACHAVLHKEGVTPVLTAGHSLGEYSALVAAGYVTSEDAIRLVHMRGKLMHRESTKHKGAMSAIIGLNINDVEEIVATARDRGVVSVANHNTETQVVITGEPEAVSRVNELAAAKGAKAIALNVSGAWHSELVRGAEDDFRAFLQSITFKPPQAPLLFNVSADPETDLAQVKENMAQQLCSRVRWYESVQKMPGKEIEVFAEIGPKKVLGGLVQKILPESYPREICSVGNLKSIEQFLKIVA